MAGIKYNETQVKELSLNKYVKKISEKYITFTLECKIEFLRLSNKGIFYRDIFKKLGFPEYIVNSDIPKKANDRWKSNQNKGEIEKQKGRPKKEKIDLNNITKDEYIKYLEARLAYHEELEKYLKSGYP